MRDDESFYVIDGALLASIERVAKRLHSEERLVGDEMRDLGHALAHAAKKTRQWPIPEGFVPGKDHDGI